MNDEIFSHLNQRGFIPGPLETEEEFSKRVDYCLKVREHIKPVIGDKLTEGDLKQEYLILHEALPLAKSLFDISPDWIPLFFSNFKLSFWQGGCAWIFQITDQSPTSAVLQLRRKFLTSPVLFPFYQRKEVIAHELVHAARMAFNEPKYEEILAYQTSQSKLRCWLGGIVQSQKEVWLFFFSLMMSSLGLFLSIWSGLPGDDPLIWILWTLPFILIFLAFFRNIKKQRIFKKCLENLNKSLKDPSKALAVMMRLTDEEIEKFSSFSPSEIIQYAQDSLLSSLRWRIIYKVYFI